MKNLREKLFKVFEVYYTDNTSNKAILVDLGRRGKLTIKGLSDMMFIFLEEIEELKEKVEDLKKKKK